MGFFGDLGKALIGQPVSKNTPAPTPVGGSHAVADEHGYKIIPTIELRDIRSHRQGNRLIVTAWVVNDSDQQIRIDYCYLIKQKRQFNQDLAPHQSHQVSLYDGPAPHDEAEHRAQIVYRLHANGDSFQNTYRIVYHLEHDGTRTVDTLQMDVSGRDI